VLLVRTVGDVSGVELRSGVDPADTHGRAVALPIGEVCTAGLTVKVAFADVTALVLPMGEAGPLGRPRGACSGCC